MLQRLKKSSGFTALYIVPMLYIGLLLAPASFWYNAGTLAIADSDEYTPLILSYDGGAKRDFVGSYSVIARDIRNQQVVCDARGGPFAYKPGAQRPVPLTMNWWAPSDRRCATLPEGAYVVETCWSVHGVLWGVIPDKTTCTTSNPFNITKPEKGDGK